MCSKDLDILPQIIKHHAKRPLSFQQFAKDGNRSRVKERNRRSPVQMLENKHGLVFQPPVVAWLHFRTELCHPLTAAVRGGAVLVAGSGAPLTKGLKPAASSSIALNRVAFFSCVRVVLSGELRPGVVGEVVCALF